MSSLKTITLKLDPELLEELDQLAKELKRPRSWIIRDAIKHYIEEIEDLEIAIGRLMDPDSEWIDHEDLKNELGIQD